MNLNDKERPIPMLEFQLGSASPLVSSLQCFATLLVEPVGQTCLKLAAVDAGPSREFAARQSRGEQQQQQQVGQVGPDGLERRTVAPIMVCRVCCSWLASCVGQIQFGARSIRADPGYG